MTPMTDTERDRLNNLEREVDAILNTNTVEHIMLQKAVWKGDEMINWFNEGDIAPEQIQPNGIDLRVDKVLEQRGTPILTFDDSFKDPGMLWEIPTRLYVGINYPGWYLGPMRYYVVQWAETVEIPPNAIGLLSPRSSLLRMGATILGAVWDRGYRGRGQSGLACFSDIMIERGARLAQMVFVEAQFDKNVYKGQYQGENIDAPPKEKIKEKEKVT